MLAKKSSLILTLIMLINSFCGADEAKSVCVSTDQRSATFGPYGMRADKPGYVDANIANRDVGVIHAASKREVSTSLAYSSYIFTTNDIVLFSYEDGTQVELYDSAGNPVSVVPNVLDKGEHTYVNTSTGVYFVAGSNKFAVLTGDATTIGVSGYYAMDAQGRGVGREFYTYAPALHEHCEFIVFAYQDGTSVTIQQEVTNGVYEDIASFTLDKGEHWSDSSLEAKYLHVIADKPVSALTCYDQSYFVPSANGWWSGTEFYAYVSNIEYWPEDLTVIAYHNDTFVSIKDSDTQTVVWEGTLDSGQAHVKSYPIGADQYFTITSNKVVTVDVQPWVATTSGYYQGVFIPNKDGTGMGTELIGPTLGGGYLYILAHTDNTHINLYNSQTGAWQDSNTLDRGEIVNANPGNGLWKITSDKDVSAYSGCSYECTAEFAPLEFNKAIPILEKVDDVNDCVVPGDEINYRIDYNYPAGPNLPDTNIIDYLPNGVGYCSSDPCGTYDSNSHTVTWHIGTLEPGESGFVTLKVKVSAEPCRTITNNCEIRSGGETLNNAYEYTPVCWSSNPKPTNCATDVDRNSVLIWRPGPKADKHDVYLGTDFDDVNDANRSNPLGVLVSENQEPNYYKPGILESYTTYYWRIDEVNYPNVWKGAVWRFKTANWLTVEDFDSYADTAAMLDVVWFAKTGTTGISLETTKVRSGKSMKFYYENDINPYRSEADVNTLLLPSGIGRDWTLGGSKALTLYFYGSLSNDANEHMYVKLTDADSSATVTYDGDASDVRELYWHEWNIRLADFAGITMSNVRKMTIGFGDGVQSPDYVEPGTVYFDDIRLYPPRCLQSLAGDLNGDCVVDYRDLKIMTDQWLDTGSCCQADLYEDDKVNFRDFAILAENWLEEGQMWP